MSCTGGEAGISSRQVSAKHRYAIFCSVASRHLDPRCSRWASDDTPRIEPYGFSSLTGRCSMRKHGIQGSIKNWRRGRDSNPGYRLTRHNGFRDRRIQPLCHLSAKSRHYATRRSWICSGIGKASEGSSGARDSLAARPSNLWAVRASVKGRRSCVRRSRSVNSLRGPRRGRVIEKVAERQGFEPWIRFWRIHDFQSCSFGQLGHLSVFSGCDQQRRSINQSRVTLQQVLENPHA